MFTLRQRHADTEQPTGIRMRTLVALVALVAGLTVSAASSAGATSDAQRQEARAAGITLRQHIDRADRSLARARAFVRARRMHKAIRSLRHARFHTVRANVAAGALIGAPPADPESDDLPGPPAVLAATRLDYRITVGAVALFDRHTRLRLVRTLKRTVLAAQVRRDAVLDPVIALPAEGDGADYADGIADSLGQYGREVRTISIALRRFTLTPAGRTGLTRALARAQATRAKVTTAFGGGERVTS